MRVGAWLTRTEFTFLFGGGSTGWTGNGKRLFEAEFFFHVGERMPQTRVTWMVNLEQFSESTRCALRHRANPDTRE
jgi:hypothetical protein